MTQPSDESWAYYATRFSTNPARAAVWRHIAAWLARSRVLQPADDVLELAAGYGDFVKSLRTSGRIVAMDINPMLKEFIEPPIQAVIGDSSDLSRFENESFDVVFASNFLEHLTWPEIDRCIDGVARVLRPGGRFVALQPNFRLTPRRYFDDYTHRTIFTDQSLSDYLTSRRFRILRNEPRFLPLSMKSRLSGAHRAVPLYLRLPWRPLAGQMLVVAAMPAAV